MLRPLPISFISTYLLPVKWREREHYDLRGKIYQFHFLCCSGVAKSHVSDGSFRTSVPLLGSADEAVRPRKGRNFFKFTEPAKGRMGLEPQAPDSQARASHSPVLCSSFPQSKGFWSLLSPSPSHLLPHPTGPSTKSL